MGRRPRGRSCPPSRPPPPPPPRPPPPTSSSTEADETPGGQRKLYVPGVGCVREPAPGGLEAAAGCPCQLLEFTPGSGSDPPNAESEPKPGDPVNAIAFTPV